MVAKVAIVITTLSAQLATLAEAEKKGIEAAGGTAEIFQLPETPALKSLDEEEDEAQVIEDGTAAVVEEVTEVKEIVAEPKKFDYPLADKDVLLEYEFYLLGISTDLGSIPTQWAQFWDRTGGLWAKGAFNGKVAGLFSTSAGYGDGQEAAIKSFLNYLAHHGIIYIPLGYKNVFAEIANTEEVHGGNAWGAGTLCGPDGSREPSPLELKVAETQGSTFYTLAKKFIKPSKSTDKSAVKEKEKKAETTKRVSEKADDKAAEPKKSSSLIDGCCTLM